MERWKRMEGWRDGEMAGMERWEGMEWWEEMERLEETERRGQGWVVGEAPLPRVADPLLDVDRGEGVLRTGAPHSCSTVAGAGAGGLEAAGPSQEVALSFHLSG